MRSGGRDRYQTAQSRMSPSGHACAAAMHTAVADVVEQNTIQQTVTYGNRRHTYRMLKRKSWPLRAHPGLLGSDSCIGVLGFTWPCTDKRYSVPRLLGQRQSPSKPISGATL